MSTGFRMSTGFKVFRVLGPRSLLLLALSVPAAFANTSLIWNLNIDGSSGGTTTGSNTVGTVTVTDLGSGLLGFDVSLGLVNGTQVYFQSASNAQHSSFAYNLAKGSTVSATSVVSNTSYWTPFQPAKDQNFGQFTNGLNCAGSNGGGNGPCGSSRTTLFTDLSFTISGTNLNLANFALSSGGGQSALFAADISYKGLTGSIGATGSGVSINPLSLPEAGMVDFLAFDLAVAAIVGVFYSLRRKRGASVEV